MTRPVYSVRLAAASGESTGVGVINLFSPSAPYTWVLRDATINLVGFSPGDAMALEVLPIGLGQPTILALLPDAVSGQGFFHWQGRLVFDFGDVLRLSFATSGIVTYAVVASGYQLILD